MDQASFIRVKLEFGKNVKVAKLDSRVDTSLSSMANLRKLIYKNFPEVGEIVEASGRSGAATMPLTVRCLDSVGDFVSLENDEDLAVALENLPKSNDLRFKVEVIPQTPIGAALAALTVGRSNSKGSGSRLSARTYATATENYRVKPELCEFFERGHCRYGPTCRYSHDLPRKESPPSLLGRGYGRGRGFIKTKTEAHAKSSNELLFRDVREVDYWLMNQLELVPGENIEQLSGEKGLRALAHVVERRNLPSETITLFVKLLVKDEVRTSLLRHKTNKIYGVLLGSHFLLQLHGHIASHLGNPIRAPKAQDVMPYLLLTEELQSRTADGWKQVPLDALQSVVLKLQNNAGKDDLMAIVSRLIDQREKLQRSLAIAPPDKCLQGAKFREVSIVPSKEELFRFQARQDLPVNRIGMQYSRVSDYLETHFQLLREDCIDPLRQGIKCYRSNRDNAKPSEKSSQELRIYSGVKLHGVRCGDQGVEHVLSFDIPARENNAQQWESSKKLMFGALLCISADQFQTFFWGAVAGRDVKDLAKGLVAIRIMGESDPNVTVLLQRGQQLTTAYVMVESTAAYFEAYYHVLRSLQRVEMEDVPFTKYLLRLEPGVSPPAYLLRRKSGDAYDFSSTFPGIHKRLGKSSIRLMQSEWPDGWGDSLDVTQREALKQGLTKELAIIQGPPGTGKTFLGLVLVKLLLANLSQNLGHDSSRLSHRRAELDVLVNEENKYDICGPILVVCYTNHALDQFLDGIYRNGETNLIRIGGRSKSDLLKDNNLQSLLQKQRMENKMEGSHRRLFGEGRRGKDDLESAIHHCIDEMGINLVTCNKLDGVATLEQIVSLFMTPLLKDDASKKIVQIWLREAQFDDPYLVRHFFVNNQSQEGDELFEIAEAREKPLRGQVKPLPKSKGDEDGEWTPVRRRRGPRRAPIEHFQVVGENPDGHDDWRLDVADAGPNAIPAQALEGNEDNPVRAAHDIAVEGGPIEEEYRLQDFVDAPNVWDLNFLQRRMLHEYWVEEIRTNQRRKLRELTLEYEEACKNVIEVENETRLSLLRKSKVVGMTTTAAARYHDVLKSLKPEIIIVEEAAEVLEGHILACLSPSVKHLILIGDHLQLRPSLAVYRLSIENKLDVSMFERLVKSGVEHVTLQEQRRMRPSISKLVRSLYPRSRDHQSVTRYEPVKGVRSNVFFFDHKADEDNVRDASSKLNSTEAKLVVELCIYFLQQGYKPGDIAILSMYTGQLVEIKTLLSQRASSKWSRRPVGKSSEDPGGEKPDLPRVSSVDDYQGEESDIIILSLVRSNTIVTDEGVGKIGFLRTPNRICVALTRARKGFFIFGNADLLAEKSQLWNEVTTTMRNDGELGPELELYCQNHPGTITRISKTEDFKQVEDGGCSLPCEFQLECGHACPRRCHPGSHDQVVCPKPCLTKYDGCPHVCKLRCHGPSQDCPSCVVIVTKQMPDCGHQQEVECSKDVRDENCRSNCPKNLQCGHLCGTLCGRPCTILCQEKVVKVLPCGHSARISCHNDPATYSCDQSCIAILQDCQHPCRGNCGKCKQGTAHIPCQQKCGRILPCGHLCEAGCSLSCPPCLKRCRKRCFHSRCSEVCGNLCKPCREPCSWQCEHNKCEKLCHEICSRPRCDLPCNKLIPKCKHRCIGLCGEPCPTKCRVCHPDTLDVITRMTLEEYEESDTFVELDCGHIFEVSGLDTWMDSNETAEQQGGNMAIKLKECPECRTPIWRTNRYSNVVKNKHSHVEDVKKRIFGHEKTRQGNILLDQGDDIGALSAFRQALQENPGLMEAHYGTARAFCAGCAYAKAITHLSFIVERSSFSSALANLIKSARGSGHLDGYVEKFYGQSPSRAGDSIAKHAIVQWAVALTKSSREFTCAIQLCDAVLARDPENRLAAEVKDKAKKGVVQLVVQAMAADVGTRGHWYTCPNGHYYTIGECGGAVEVSKCPDCNAQVGGGNHRLLAGNSHANIDGSDRSAYS